MPRGNLCENHLPYPVEKLLPEFHEMMARLDAYQEETVQIAQGNASAGQSYAAEIKIDPKDATLQIDGHVATPGKMQLAVGPHTVSVARSGYREQELRITMFPDVQPRLKVKLKKL